MIYKEHGGKRMMSKCEKVWRVIARIGNYMYTCPEQADALVLLCFAIEYVLAFSSQVCL